MEKSDVNKGRKLDKIKEGTIERFVQVYNRGLPEIVFFKKNVSKNLEEDCEDFYNSLVGNLPCVGKIRYVLAGGGRVTLPNGGKYIIYNESGSSLKIDAEHLEDYKKLNDTDFELR